MKFLFKRAEKSGSHKSAISSMSEAFFASQPNIADTIGPERRPDFFCIGSEKAGTTWLWHWMRQHPELGVPASKELRYFRTHNTWDQNHFRALTRFLEDPAKAPDDKRFKRCVAEQIRLYYGGLPGYLRIFGQMTEPVVGELSPQYCILPNDKIRSIHAVAPEAKIIYMLRDPVERLLSGARMAIRHNKLELTEANLLEFANNDIQRRHSDAPTHLENYERVFGAENVTTVLFDNIGTDPAKAFSEVCGFLGVSAMAFDESEMKKVVNKGAELDASASAKATLRASLAPVYDRLATRYPVAVDRWLNAD